jgi:hypothetical protein
MIVFVVGDDPELSADRSLLALAHGVLADEQLDQPRLLGSAHLGKPQRATPSSSSRTVRRVPGPRRSQSAITNTAERKPTAD